MTKMDRYVMDNFFRVFYICHFSSTSPQFHPYACVDSRTWCADIDGHISALHLTLNSMNVYFMGVQKMRTQPEQHSIDNIFVFVMRK